MWYVFYRDGYHEDGGVGLTCHQTQEDAIAHIEQRMKEVDVPNIREYVLIEGRKRQIEVIEVASKVQITD